MTRNPYKKADHFSRRAKQEGYAARSVYKLEEIDKRYPIFSSGQRVVDLGCHPGSWARFALKKIGRKGKLVGIDLTETDLGAGTFIQQSIYDVNSDQLVEILGAKADVVLSDMAPLTTGNTLLDHVNQLELASGAYDLASKILKPGGSFVTKVFDGEDAGDLVQGLRPYFGKVKRLRPKAVRKVSREFFVVCLGHRPG